MPEVEETQEQAVNVQRFVSCIADIFDQFIKTGERTPAHGECYVHHKHDLCATVYDHGRKAMVFFNRRNGYTGREKWPCFYADKFMLRLVNERGDEDD